MSDVYILFVTHFSVRQLAIQLLVIRPIAYTEKRQCLVAWRICRRM